jgi:hypothetical protein
MPNRKFCGVCGHAFPTQSSTEYSTPPSGSGGYATPPSGAGGYATPPAGSGGYATPTSGSSGYSQPTVGGYTPPSSPYSGVGAMGAGYGGYSGAAQGSQRYKALRVMAVLYKVLAFILAGLAAILGLITLTSPRTFGLAYNGGANVVAALFWFISGALVFVFLFGAGEFIILFINVEENTRTTNELLQRRNESSNG